MSGDEATVAAVVLAAGLSRRMGAPKMVLPWKQTTVIGQVAEALVQAGIGEIVVVTGGGRAQVEAALQGYPVHLVYNPHHAEDNMACSLKVGLSALSEKANATLVALGDQPQIEPAVVQAVVATYQLSRAELVAPSYQKHRGHPWLLARSLWPEVLDLLPGFTLRDFLNTHAGQIDYLEVDSPSVLQDLDTPEDYQRSGYN